MFASAQAQCHYSILQSSGIDRIELEIASGRTAVVSATADYAASAAVMLISGQLARPVLISDWDCCHDGCNQSPLYFADILSHHVMC